ncbi:MAG: hypothetical protein FJX18_03380 [Alphaproteobacteria bacterium]|nr:hypothetical protein [Alphaproteobacteria bacterium]
MLKEVFILYHTYGSDEEEDNNWKELGVYSTRSKAWNAIKRFKRKPGFKSHPKGFLIDKYNIDCNTCWLSGFSTGISPISDE